MTNLKLFLRDGEWYGNEFPEEPSEPWSGRNTPHQDDLHEEWQKYHEAIEKDKSEALEIINPSLLNAMRIALNYEDGVLYPWDGGAEIQYQYKPDPKAADWVNCHVSVYHDYQKEDNKKFGSSRKVLRLLLKSPVTDKYEI